MKIYFQLVETSSYYRNYFSLILRLVIPRASSMSVSNFNGVPPWGPYATCFSSYSL